MLFIINDVNLRDLEENLSPKKDWRDDGYYLYTIYIFLFHWDKKSHLLQRKKKKESKLIEY